MEYIEHIYRITDVVLKIATAILLPILAWIIHNILHLTKRITSIEIKTNEIIREQISLLNEGMNNVNQKLDDKIDTVYESMDRKFEKMEGNLTSKLDLVLKILQFDNRNNTKE
jgi:hypothetical protein